MYSQQSSIQMSYGLSKISAGFFISLTFSLALSVVKNKKIVQLSVDYNSIEFRHARAILLGFRGYRTLNFRIF